jgi:Ca2+-binding RTX toxin-like protein
MGRGSAVSPLQKEVAVRRLILLMAAMAAAVLLVSGVAYALSVQCDGAGDQDPAPGLCQGTEQNDRITGSQERDEILALGGRDLVTARGGDDFVDGGRRRDDISGGVGGDGLFGGGGPDDIDGGQGTTDASPPLNTFFCSIRDPEAGIDASAQGTQNLLGDDGNDDLDGGRDNDFLRGGAGRNDLSGNGGDDCLNLNGAANERASGGDGDDIIFADESFFGADSNGDDVFCGAGHDTVNADEDDRVAADCEDVLVQTSLQATGSTPVVEVTITTEEGTITMRP